MTAYTEIDTRITAENNFDSIGMDYQPEVGHWSDLLPRMSTVANNSQYGVTGADAPTVG